MNIEIKKSIKPIKYENAIYLLEKRLKEIHLKKNKELIWILEHKKVFTGGASYKESEIIDKSIELIKTNRGGKITYHGPGQLIFYFVIDLNQRGRDIRKLITSVENTIIKTLKEFKINTYADRENIGIWYKRKLNNKTHVEKVAAIGIKVKKWIAFHGFAINISNNLDVYKKIIPCGIKERKVTNLMQIKDQKYTNISDMLVKNFLKEIKN